MLAPLHRGEYRWREPDGGVGGDELRHMAVVSRVEVVAVGGCYALYGLKKLFSVHFLGCLRSGTAFAGPILLIKMLIFGFRYVDNLAALIRCVKIISRLSLCTELLKTQITDVIPIVDMFITYLLSALRSGF